MSYLVPGTAFRASRPPGPPRPCRPPGHWHGGDAQSSGCAISQATRPRRDATRRVAGTAGTSGTSGTCHVPRHGAGVLTRPNRASRRQAHPKPRCRMLTMLQAHVNYMLKYNEIHVELHVECMLNHLNII